MIIHKEKITINLREGSITNPFPCEKACSLNTQETVEALHSMPKTKGVSEKIIGELIKAGRRC